MDLTEFNDRTKDILDNLNDQGSVTNTLADLQNGFTEALSARADAEAKANELESRIKKLQEDNMRLYLRITVPNKPEAGEIMRPETDKNPVNSLYENGRLNLKG